MMTQLSTAALPAASDTIGGLEFEILDLDPDVAALIAEVDAILCAALTPARRPPTPPVTGCTFVRPVGWSVLRWGGSPSGVDPCNPCTPRNAALRSQTGPRRRPQIRKAGDGITTEIAERPAPGDKTVRPASAEDSPMPHPGAFTGGGQSGHITGLPHRQVDGESRSAPGSADQPECEEAGQPRRRGPSRATIDRTRLPVS